MSTLWELVRRLWREWGFAAFCVLVIATFHSVLLPFFLALLLAYVLAPVVARLARIGWAGHRMPRSVAVIVCYLGMFGVLGLFFGAFLPRLSGDLARLVHEAPQFFATVKTSYVPRVSRWIEEQLGSEADAVQTVEGPRPERRLLVTRVAEERYSVSLEELDLEVDAAGKGRWVLGPRRDPSDTPTRVEDWIARLASAGESQATEVLKLGQRLVTGVIQFVGRLVLVLMLAGFILVDAERMLGFLHRLAPVRHREAFGLVLHEIDRGLGGVVRGQLLICLVNGVLTYVGLLIFSVKYALLLGMLAGGMSIIPVFGSILSSIPIVAIALVSGSRGVSITLGLLVLGWILLIHLVEANYLNPKIIGQAAKIHPVVVVFALLAGEHSGGLVGALVAVPVASVMQTLFLYFLHHRSETELVFEEA